MSFRQALRSRFKGEGKGEDEGSGVIRKGSGKRPKTLVDNKNGEETFEVLLDKEEDQMSFRSASSHSPAVSEGSDIMAGFKDTDEKGVFEQQLTQLQEQLVAVMIENQTLQTELREYREASSLDKMRQELEYERHRNQLLEEKCLALDKKRSRKVQRSKSDADTRRRLTESLESSVEVTEDEGLDGPSDLLVPTQPIKTKGWFDRLWEAIMKVVYDFMDDFSDIPAQEKDEDPEGDPLSVKKLKDNIKRFGTEAKPYLTTAQGIYNLLTWRSPPYTLIVFIVYMYSVWVGCFLPVMLFCFTFRLFINYLRYRGWNINFNFFDQVDEEKKESDDSKDLGVSDKFNLVLQVARKVQNFLGSFADSLEKIKSLFTWRYAPASKQLFFVCLFGAIASCVFPTTHLFYIGGLLMGVKMFLVDYLYHRFPRLKHKYDTSHQMWLRLPTDAEYEKRNMKSELNKYILPSSRPNSMDVDKLEPPGGDTGLSTDDRTFCELFHLPLTECPLPGWQGGRRCTLINREKSLTAAFKNGKLYLTRSFLCFERTKTPSPKNIVIPLADITKMEKAKPYSWLPGGGMAIEIAVTGSDKPFIFGGILNRDEILDSLQDYGIFQNLPWMKRSVSESMTPNTQRRKVKQFQNFSLGASAILE